MINSMPSIHIREARQRSFGEAEGTIGAVAEAGSVSGEARPPKIQLVLAPIQRAHWGIGGKVVKTQDDEVRS